MSTPPSELYYYGKCAFDYNVRRDATLYVPVSSYQDYMITDWRYFDNIKTFDPAPVESVSMTDKSVEVSRYTVDGQRQGNPVKGLNIVKMSDGTVKKVMVK